MALPAVLSKAIGGIISSCVGDPERPGEASPTAGKRKQPSTAAPENPGQSLSRSKRATSSSAVVPKAVASSTAACWWSDSSDEGQKGGARNNQGASTGGMAPSGDQGRSYFSNQAVVDEDACNNGSFGLACWNTTRRQWTGTLEQRRARRRPRFSVLSPDVVYEDILSTSRPFPEPVPLAEMVDFLVDHWDQEGLYD